MKKTVKIHYGFCVHSAKDERGQRVLLAYSQRLGTYADHDDTRDRSVREYLTRPTMKGVQQLVNRARRDVPGGVLVLEKLGNGGRQQGKRLKSRVIHLTAK